VVVYFRDLSTVSTASCTVSYQLYSFYLGSGNERPPKNKPRSRQRARNSLQLFVIRACLDPRDYPPDATYLRKPPRNTRFVTPLPRRHVRKSSRSVSFLSMALPFQR
jgi:hypothetical protein